MSCSMAAAREELTPRESEVLAAVERRLTNAEIAEEMVVSVRTVETHIAALRRKLGVDSRAGLVAAARARRAHAVPVPRNTFVGRQRDVDAVRGLLATRRWVTLVGAAGSGKTRLALELAARDRRVPVVVDLQHTEPDDCAAALARPVGLAVDGSGTDLAAASAVALRAQPYLLVLDNGDRVAGPLRDLVGRLLALVPGLTVLATSQTPLGGPEEVVHAVEPLPVDDDVSSGAVRLFLDRAATGVTSDGDGARGAGPGAPDIPLVARICRRLDGLPLAVELAAARVRHLPLRELADRLDEGFDALDGAGHSSRHSTLTAAFTWTWELLDEDEQTVLARLAALPRTFDLDLAAAVTTPRSAPVVLRLLDRSLLSPAPPAGETRRFRLLEPRRDFVLGRTPEAVVHEVRRRHAVHHAAIADGLRRRARTDDSREAAATAAWVCPEATAAIDWALVNRPDLALVLGRALAVGSEQYGPSVDSLAAVARVARSPDARALAGPEALFDLGMALCYGDLALVAELDALATERADDAGSLLHAEHLAAMADAYRHDPRAALVHAATAERLAVELSEPWHLASVLMAKGLAQGDLSDPGTAIETFESSMRTFALAGDAMHVNNTRYMMAVTAVDHGTRTDDALGWAEECIAYARSSGNEHELAHAELTAARLRGGATGDDRDLSAVMDTFRRVGDLRCLTRCYFLLADGRSPRHRVPLLEQALEVATAAHDRARQRQALEDLVRSRWQAGERRDAAAAYGMLVALVGRERAEQACPDDMRAELDRWDATIAEGVARISRPR